MPWDRRLTVTCDGEGLVGQTGGIILREMADVPGLTAELRDALEREGRFPEVDRGVAMVSAAVMIALGGRSMSGIAVLDHLSLVLGEPVTWQTLRRTLDLADPGTLEKIAQARARIRAHVWELIAARACGFPWLETAGRVLHGWVVLDMDATLVTAFSPKEGASGTYKSGFGFHPLGCWCANTGESMAMELRPGNAGSNTAADHISGLSAALAQIPPGYRRNVIVRLDGAGASHLFIEHMVNLEIPGVRLLFTCGWTITGTDEDDIRQIPGAAWKPGVTQDGHAEDDSDVTEITGLMTRSGNWPDGLRWIVRRVKPSRRHLKNLTAYERSERPVAPRPTPASPSPGSNSTYFATICLQKTSISSSERRGQKSSPNMEITSLDSIMGISMASLRTLMRFNGVSLNPSRERRNSMSSDSLHPDDAISLTATVVESTEIPHRLNIACTFVYAPGSPTSLVISTLVKPKRAAILPVNVLAAACSGLIP
jgi:hypothetical protein